MRVRSRLKDSLPVLVIFSGFNQRAILSFLRTLSSIEISYAIIALSSKDDIYSSEFSSRIMATRAEPKLDIDDIKRCCMQVKDLVGAAHYLIAPSTEALIRFVHIHQGVFEGMGFYLPLVPPDLYSLVSDKHRFGSLCASCGLNIPREFEMAQAKVPCVAKPRAYKLDHVLAPVLLLNDRDMQVFRERFDIQEFYLQEFIEGESHYLLMFFYRDGRCITLSQKNLVQQPDGKSIIAAVLSDIHTLPVARSYEDLFRKIGFYGLVMVELRRSNEGHFYMIEANPRFWGPSQLFVDAGLNLFEHFLCDNGFPILNISSKIKRFDARYFWHGGLAQTVARNGTIALHAYTLDELALEMPAWIEADVYRRHDSIALYEAEVFASKERA